MSDLIISSPLDQESSTNGDWALKLIDEKVQEAIEVQDVTILFETIKRLRDLAKVTGLALAKVLYRMNQHWASFEINDDFNDAVFDGTGLSKHTVERYVKVWSMFEQNRIPAKLIDEFKQKNIKDLIPIAHALDQGYEIDSDDWQELAFAPDYATVAKHVRDEIKHAEPRKNALQLYVKRDGTVIAFKNNVMENVAWLDVDNESEMVQQAIERIKKNSGMLEE